MRWSADDIGQKIRQLETTPAHELEGETLEFKSRPRGPQQLREWVVECAVAFANQRGGCLIAGINDKAVGLDRAIEGIGQVSYSTLKRDVYDGTDPHILVDIEELSFQQETLLAIHVSKGIPPHTDSKGRGTIRIGANNMPLKGSMIAARMANSRAVDPSAQVFEGVGIGSLDERAIAATRQRLLENPAHSSLVNAGATEVLDALELEYEEGLTMTALLLFGKKSAIAKLLPQHEITVLHHTNATRYERRLDLKGPIILELTRIEEILATSISIRTLRPHGFAQLEIPSLGSEASREAIINAIAHRDYFPNQGTLVAIRENRIEVQSPGGFLPGITPGNILRHAPARRNSRLAECLQKLSLANRSGVGVDRIFEDLLRSGAKPPVYVADLNSVSLSLPFAADDAFAAWIVEFERGHERLQLDDLIVLRRVTDVGAIDRWSASEQLQIDESAAAFHLADMRERGLLTPHGRGRGTSYGLPRPLSERLRGRGATNADRALESEGVRLRILQLLEERGKLSNAEIRAFSGYSRSQVLAIEKELEREGKIELRGKGRGAHIALAAGGDQLPGR